MGKNRKKSRADSSLIGINHRKQKKTREKERQSWQKKAVLEGTA
jgi:hypothetical protein